MTDGCSDLQRDTDLAHGRLPVRRAAKVPTLPADIPQCVADSLTGDELRLMEGSRPVIPKVGRDIIVRLCEVAEQKDKVHQLLVDRVNEFIAGEGNDDHE